MLQLLETLVKLAPHGLLLTRDTWELLETLDQAFENSEISESTKDAIVGALAAHLDWTLCRSLARI